MGQSFTKNDVNSPMLEEMKIFLSWSIDDVRELHKRFRLQICGFALVEEQFESIIAFKKSMLTSKISLETIFDILDNDHDGRIDGLEFMGGLTWCCQGSFEDKAKFCFELFDFNLNSSLSPKELIVLMMSTMSGLNILIGKNNELNLNTLEALSKEAFLKADLNKSNSISFSEFVGWVRSNRDLMSAIDFINKSAQEYQKPESIIDNEDNEDSNNDSDEDEDENEQKNYKMNHSKLTENYTPKHEKFQNLDEIKMPTGGDENQCEVQWKHQIHSPTQLPSTSKINEGPDSNLSLHYAFGYSSNQARDTVRYIQSNQSQNQNSRTIIYPTASLIVVFNVSDHSQQFYQGHSSQVTCMSLHSNGHTVVSGDMASTINIWDCETLATINVIKNTIKNGIQDIKFAPNSNIYAIISFDQNHTISFYDASSTSTNNSIGSTKGIPDPKTINNLCFSPNSSELAIVSKNIIRIYKNFNTVSKLGPRKETSTSSEVIKSVTVKFEKVGVAQNFLSLVYINDDTLVVGCVSGEMYKIVSGKCVQAIKAYKEKDALTSMFFNSKESILLTGSKSGIIKTWDMTLKEIGMSINILENETEILQPSIFSIQSMNDFVLVGTKGSDIFEIQISKHSNEKTSIQKLQSGHFNQISFVSSHPSKHEVVTCSNDKTIRVWDIINKKQIGYFLLESICTALSYHCSGDIIAIGMNEGNVSIVDCSNNEFNIISTWKHTNRPVTDIKFSANGLFLAVASRDTTIYIYKSNDKRTFTRHGLCKGHSGAITHIDFSLDNQYIQSCGTEGALLFWSTSGNQIKSSASMCDVIWATNSCVFGWGVQGIWPKFSDFTDVNTCIVDYEHNICISGDDNKLVNLYRYPSLVKEPIHRAYIGHGSHVMSLCLSFDKKYCISVGGVDNTIIVWYHDVDEDDNDDNASVSSNGSGVSATDHRIELLNDVPIDVDSILFSPSHGDEFMAIKPWKGAIVEPTIWNKPNTPSECNFTLEWVQGYRSDSRNNLFYSSTGSIVYNAASVGVIFNKTMGTQSHIVGAHKSEILCICAHPSGQIFATGESGKQASIVVWSSQDSKIVNRFEKTHERGVQLLAFNSQGTQLASIGLDNDNSLAVYDLVSGRELCRTPTDKGKVFCLCYMKSESSFSASSSTANKTKKDKIVPSKSTSSCDILVTAGEKHVKFWSFQGKNVTQIKASWAGQSKCNIVSVASGYSDVILTGSSKGDLYVWQNQTIIQNVKTQFGEGAYPHKGSLQTIWPLLNSNSDSTLIEYLTGDKLGMICRWKLTLIANKLQLSLLASISTNQFLPFPIGCGVQSICVKDDDILIGTSGSDIYEISLNSLENDVYSGSEIITSTRLMAGHAQGGELWALATHTSLPVYFTAGDDQTLRCYGVKADGHNLLGIVKLPAKCRAIDVMPLSGRDIAVALSNGKIIVVKSEALIGIDFDRRRSSTKMKNAESHDPQITLVFDDSGDNQAVNAINLPVCSKKFSQELKYCFNDSILAVGTHDTNIYLYNIKNDGSYELNHKVCHAHTSYITHIDFGVILLCNETTNQIYDPDRRSISSIDRVTGETLSSRQLVPSDICLQSTCGAYELLFWSSDGSRITSPSVVKDAYWTTWTSILGWPVQGIWQKEMDGTDIQAVCRSQLWSKIPILVTADDEMCVRVFSYPCLTKGSPEKCYRGHASHVTNARFTRDDEYCVTTGGRDNCVFVWKTDILDELRARSGNLSNTGHSTTRQNLPIQLPTQTNLITTNSNSNNGSSPPMPPSYDAVASLAMSVVDDLDIFKCCIKYSSDNQKVFDEIQNSWRTEVRDPTKYKKAKKGNIKFNPTIQLSWIYGCRSWDSRENIRFSNTQGDIAYHVSGVAMSYNSHDHTQIHCDVQKGNIVCLASCKELHLIASGEYSPKETNANIIIWDGNSGQTVTIISFHTIGVSHLDFTPSANLIVSVGMDESRTLAIHNVSNGHLVGRSKVGRETSLLCLRVSETFFVTGGVNHIKFWEIPSELHPGGEIVSKNGLYRQSSNLNPMARIVSSISFAIYSGVCDTISGMADGSLILWKDRSTSKSVSGHNSPVTSMISLLDRQDRLSSGGIVGRVASGSLDGFVVIWNEQLSKVWSLNMSEVHPKSVSIEISSLDTLGNLLLIGTRGSDVYEVDITKPSDSFQIVQAHGGSKCKINCIAAQPGRASKRFSTGSDDCTVRVWCGEAKQCIGFINIGAKVNSIAYSCDGLQIAIGTSDGQLKILSYDLKLDLSTTQISSQKIESLSFSPDGSTLAIGCNDCVIYLVDTKTYHVRGQCKGHLKSIVALDFSNDSRALMSASKSQELMFWDCSTTKRLQPETVRDLEWFSTTCVIGWSVQKLWDEGIVKSLCKSSQKNILAACRAKEGNEKVSVELFPFPCNSDSSSYVESVPIHSSGHTLLTFTGDGSQLISVSSNDNCICQWNVTNI